MLKVLIVNIQTKKIHQVILKTRLIGAFFLTYIKPGLEINFF